MKVIVLADTHSRELPAALIRDLAAADMIVHAGDFSDVEVYRHLKAMKDVRAVYGNMDEMALRDILPKQLVIECEGVRIGLVHGDGAPVGMVARLGQLFKDQNVQVVVFGHSHEPYNEMLGGILFFNPGSPTDKVRAPYLSYGVLELKDGKVRAKIVRLG